MCKNGCGDHVSLLIKSENPQDALNKAYTIDVFPKEWEDISMQLATEYYSFKYPEWLLDVEIFDHECPEFKSKYYI